MRTSSIWAVLEVSLALLVSLEAVQGAGFGVSTEYKATDNAMTRGRRRMSIVDPVEGDDDIPDSSSSTTVTQSYGVSAEALKTVEDSSTSTSAPKDSLSSNSSSTPKDSSSSSPKPSTKSNATSVPKAATSSNTTSVPKKTMPAGNATKSSIPTKTSTNSTKTNTTVTATKSPKKAETASPVVEDISQFLDDDCVNSTSYSVLPPEKEQPTSWPIVVFVTFLAAALILFAATGYKNYKRRKAYTAVPSS